LAQVNVKSWKPGGANVPDVDDTVHVTSVGGGKSTS